MEVACDVRISEGIPQEYGHELSVYVLTIMRNFYQMGNVSYLCRSSWGRRLEVGRLLARLSLHPYGARNKQLEISLNN
jgi:hypothetical protein